MTAIANTRLATAADLAAVASAPGDGDHHVAAAGGGGCGKQVREVFRAVITPECEVAAEQPAGEAKWCGCVSSAPFQACAGDSGCGQQILDALCEIDLESECP